jgi:hypothetical protein
MGDLRGELIGPGPIHGVSDLTFEMKGSARVPSDQPWRGGVTSVPAMPATAAPRPASSFELVV